MLALGPDAGDLIGVERGANVGDRVVVVDAARLSNGQRVR